jgi:hypothetical protein
MENSNNVSQNSATTANNANETSHYVLLTVGVVVGMTGVILRFVSDWVYMDLIANMIFILGTYFSLKAVIAILR